MTDGGQQSAPTPPVIAVRRSAPADAGPGQPGPAQAGPGQPAPAEAGPGQPAPAQAGPGQPGPGQAAGRTAGQDSPDQDSPAGCRRAYPVRSSCQRSSGANCPGTHGRAHDVDLAASSTPSMVTCADPRAASSEPVPFARGQVWRCGRGPWRRRRHQVDRPAPWALVSAGGQLLGGTHQERLDLVRRQLGTLVQEQRRSTRDDRGGLRRAAAAEQTLTATGRRVIWSRTELGARRLTTEAPGATRSGLRLPSPVLDQDGTTSSQCVVRAAAVRTTDRDDVRVVRRVVQLRRAVAAVAGRHHDDDAACARPASAANASGSSW